MAESETKTQQAASPIAHDAPVLNADEHLKHLLVEAQGEFFLVSLYKNLRDALFPPKLPPLEVTSKPVQVKDMWGLYGFRRSAGVTSLVIHIAVVALAFSLATTPAVQQMVKDTVTLVTPVDIAPYVPKLQKQGGGGGGGGNNNPLPASKGRLPKLAPRQFTPPSVEVLNPNPRLIMEPTVVVPLDAPVPQVNLAQFGDPFGRIGPPSSGPGSGGGIGSGSGGGVGSGRGPGVGPGEGGGFGGGVYRVGNGVTAPTLIYKVEPEYSEEARKAKYQGTVILYVEINERGLPQNPRVIRAVGLGLDEKAIEAVMKWRFRPGMKEGKPVTVAAQVEVNFRLL